MRIHKIAMTGALAVAAVPAVAFAAKPSHPTTPASTNANSHSTTAKVQFVLHGTLSAYTPANGATPGTITLTVKSANRDSTALKTMGSLTFVVPSSTKVVLHEGAAIAPSGDNGIVKLRLAKNNSTWTGLTAGQVIDQGAPATS